MIDRKPIVGVMGSHQREWSDLAEPVGRMIAEFGYHLLTGAGAGVMTAVARGFTSVEDREGMSIGIVPTANYEGDLVQKDTYPNPYIDLPIITPLDVRAEGHAMPYSRNHVNVMTSHAVIALPGAYGTKHEVSLCIQFEKPFILYGPEDAFADFPERRTRVDDLDSVREFLEQVTRKVRPV